MASKSNNPIPFDLSKVFISDIKDPSSHLGGGVLHVNASDTTILRQHLWLDDFADQVSVAIWAAENGYPFNAFTPYSSHIQWGVDYPQATLVWTLPGVPLEDSPLCDSPYVPSTPTNQPHTPIRSTFPSATSTNQPQQPVGASGQQQQQIDPAVLQAFQSFLAMGGVTAQQQVISTTPKTPSTTIPTWDGTPTTTAHFLQLMNSYKCDEYFSAVTDWTKELPQYAKESTYLATVLYPTIHSTFRAHFTSNPTYINATGQPNGILMLHDYIEFLQPSRPQHQMSTVMQILTLQQEAGETGVEYAARARGIAEQAKSISIDQLLYLTTLKGLDPELYGGLIWNYRMNIPSVVNGDIHTLSALITAEDQLRFDDSPAPGLPRASRASTPKQQPSPTEPPKPPQQDAVPAYPPKRPPRHQLVHKVFTEGQQCPICFHPMQRHAQFGGCPTAAKHGKVLVDDKEAADKVWSSFQEFTKEQRSSNRGQSSPKKQSSSDTPSNPSGRRAASSERIRRPPSVTTHPAHAASAAKPSPPSTNFYGNLIDNQEIDSDPDDDLEFLSENDVEGWSQVDAKKNSSNSNSSTSGYPVVPSAKQASLQRSYASAVLFGAPSARLASSPTSSFQSTVVSAFTSFIKQRPDQLQPLQEAGSMACADSGATDYMFPDKEAFLSYHPCPPGRYCDLAGDQSVPILGVGTAVVRLNGKVILVRNALHIPALRNPLYSLRRHRQMPGCGVFSWSGEGSFLVFPHFILCVDDSIDNLISYEPLGSSFRGRYDYAEPRPLPSARPASSSSSDASTTTSPVVIPPDDDSSTSVSSEEASISSSSSEAPTSSSSDPSVHDQPSVSSPTSSSSDPSVHDQPSVSSSSTDDTSVPSDDDILQQASLPLPPNILRSLHQDPTQLPPIPPCSVAAPCEHRTEFDSLKLHRIFGCRKFRNQNLVTAASSNASLLSTGSRPATIGDFTTIPRPPRGKPIRKRRKFLDKCHLDIVFGDSVGLHGFRYALLIVDVATRYCWIYGLTSLTGSHIVDALIKFHVDAGSLPRRFHSDFDKKLIGGKALRYILANQSSIIAAPAGRQSSNGLVERTWRTILEMGRSYMTEKQMSRDYWFFAIRHAVLMLNQIPGRLGRKLTTPYELVHGVKPDSRTWFELFSIGFFAHDTDLSSNESRSTSQAQTIAGIAVGRDPTTNTITFYSPVTRQYYRPPAFKLDESRLPVTMFPQHIHYDGGLTCGRLRHNTDPTPEPFPPGTRVTLNRDGISSKGTIQNVPIFSFPIVQSSSSDSTTSESPSTSYVVHFDDGTTAEASYEDLVSSEPEHSSAPAPNSAASIFDGLPSFLQQESKITIDHNGAFHRGYLHYSPQGGFAFVHRKTSRSKRIEWSVPLPDLLHNWPTLVGDDTIIPGHGQISSFLQPNSSNNAPSANFVSAKNLLSPCPPSLKQALHPTNPDRDVWLKSYQEEAQGLLDHNVYERISKKDYLALRRSGAIPKAIPSMCVLVVKPDKDGNPHRAKSRIVVLGNHEDRIYSKSDRYAPVLKYSSLRLLTSKAVSDKRVLQQGDCKNAFCQAILPDDEATVVRPPHGDPDYDKEVYWRLRKTLYGLRRSPRHWFNRIASILLDMGLVQSPHDPCIFSGIVDPSVSKFETSTNEDGTISVSIPHATDPSVSPTVLTLPATRQMLHIGLYVDDFVFYSTSDAEEELFRQVLQSQVTVDFMGDVDYFLGSAFLWKRHSNGHVSVHLSQSAFTEHTAHRFGLDRFKRVPNMTPYRSGLPIDSLPPPPPDDPDLKRRKKIYQGIVGSINWLAQCTRPDVSPALTFLASYSNAPSAQHYQAALHVLKYLYSTSDYGISYHSDACNTIQAFNHFPHHHDKEAYTDATPPSPSEVMQLTSFTDACWGGQFGNALPEGTPIELFKFRSLSGYVICRSGGPVAWRALRQDRTALSSCEAEIYATNECVKDTLAIKLLAQDLHMLDGSQCTPVYNDNEACVSWSASVTNKGTKHMNLRENSVREAHLLQEVHVQHIPGKINPSDLFTKEIKDASHYRRLRDSMMVSRTNFMKFGHTVPTHMMSSDSLPYYSLSASVPAHDASN